jgi:hypothetical protein
VVIKRNVEKNLSSKLPRHTLSLKVNGSPPPVAPAQFTNPSMRPNRL